MINILSGPVASGKTTRLMTWVKMQAGCSGIMAPVINQKRHLYSISINESRLLEVEKPETQDEETISIGRYHFLKSTFQWAREELVRAIRETPPFLVIDEIGPLELSGKGLEPAIGEALYLSERNPEVTQIWVVRKSQVTRVVQHYGLEGKYILDQSFLKHI
ncbi:MAG: hypothetical protein E4H13_03430 [Calditrichales bacterium]|nr:MAG: hypothetical protein E4H13_03430 [Calditrichales bacterium]